MSHFCMADVTKGDQEHQKADRQAQLQGKDPKDFSRFHLSSVHNYSQIIPPEVEL